MKQIYVFVWMTFALILAACSSSAETTKGEGSPEVVIRFVHEESPTSVQNSYVEAFKKTIEEKSNGSIAVEIYPVGQLGNGVTQAELLQIGAVDMGIVSPGNVGTIVPESQVMLLHFLFSDDMKVNQKVFNESPALYETLGKAFEDKGIKVLSYWTEGFMHWTTNRKIEQPKDFQDIKFRTMPSPLIVSSYQAYGANPTPVPYEQVYSGLQLNMIEGQTNPIFAIEQMKFYEVQEVLTLSRHSLYTTTTSINPEFYQSLSTDHKQVVNETIDEMKDKSFEIQRKFNKEDLNTIKENSSITITELSEQQRKKFREASEIVKQQYVDMVGGKAKEILKQLEEDVKKAEQGEPLR
ncbi:DctP family TRAP transporter solute-binding subunit [Pontibacillus salicampi]|uniref:DctP family TRAP transporter solute-binding subunit n=1 Tax=Pontibacillus salicampi TaxID=1449801 RepID=A0ABV6LIL3_9BACI